jgi:hypothetical protein
MGPVLDMIVISYDVEGTSFKELGWRVNSYLLCLFIVSARAHRFVFSVVTPRGYKVGGHPCVQPTSSHMISHHLLASFPTQLKRKRDRETDLEIRRVVELIGCCLFFPSESCRSWVGLHWRSRRSTVCVFLRKILVMLAAPHGGSPYLRMW